MLKTLYSMPRMRKGSLEKKTKMQIQVSNKVYQWTWRYDVHACCPWCTDAYHASSASDITSCSLKTIISWLSPSAQVNQWKYIKPGGGGLATSNKTAPESMSLNLNLVKSIPNMLASGEHKYSMKKKRNIYHLCTQKTFHYLEN